MAQTEARREYKRKWRAENPDKERAYNRRYNETHVEKRKTQRTEYQETHADEIKARRRARRAERAAYNREWRKTNPEKAYVYDRRINLRRAFGITPEKYQTMFEAQGGVCAICHQPETAKGKSLAVDHDHKTGKIRGLLCQHCNTALGKMQDSVEILQSAIDYLEFFRVADIAAR